MVVDLVGFDLVNVLLFDEVIAVVEVMVMAYCLVKGSAVMFVVDVDMYL